MKHWKKGKWLVLVICVCLLIAALTVFIAGGWGKELSQMLSEPESLQEWFAQFGPYDEAVFVLIRAVQTCVKFIPAEPLEIGAGYLWGAGGGLLWCLGGNVLGSCLILLVMRLCGRRAVKRFLPEKAASWMENFQRSDHLYLVLTIIYLIPGTPKDALVYVAGFMKVDLRIFMTINVLGRIPSILSSTLCGAALEEQQYVLSAAIFVLMLLLALGGGFLFRRWQNGGKTEH